ncbi:MAG: hypothetical protein HQL56_11520 [Magnetococcales bacterium]|nr:hypothetical protein [Magnetococcales bacterium]
MSYTKIERATMINPVADEVIREQVRHALGLGLPEAVSGRPKGEPMIVFAGGPSLHASLGTAMRSRGFKVAAGSVHDHLRRMGVGFDAAVFLDPVEGMAGFLRDPDPRATYYVASQCHPAVFEALRGHRVVLWHAEVGVDVPELVGRELVGGGSTTALRCLHLGMWWGYGQFEFHGLDSALGRGEVHAYGHPNDEEERRNAREVVCRGRRFWCTPQMIAQALDFQEVTRHFGKRFAVRVHGDGLIKEMAHPSL